MKILILNHNQERFGTYFRCFNLASALARKGVEIIMVCASGKSFDLLIRKKLIEKNFTLITLPRVTYHKYFTGQLWRMVFTIPIVLFSSYDICHAFTVAQPQIAIPALLAKWIRNKKLIVDWDDLWGGGFADQHVGIVIKVLSFFETKTPKYADRITYVSEFLGEKIKELGLFEKAVKIPNGIKNETFPQLSKTKAQSLLHLESSYKYIVSVGNTYFEGGLKVLFQAMEILQKKKKKIKLIMVGYTDILPEVQGYFEKITSSVLLPGTVSYEKVHQYIQASEAVVLPMGNNPIEKARFPIRLGDYLKSGKLIISNAVGEVYYILNKYHCGVICKQNDKKVFATAIIQAIDNKIFAKQYVRNTKQISDLFLWETISKNLLIVYKNV